MRLILFILIFINLSFVVSAQERPDSLVQDTTEYIYISQDSLISLINYRDSLVDELLHYADTFLGVPYKWAGRSRAGFDCSGYVSTVFAHIGVQLSVSAKHMEGSGRVVADSLIQVGDILYFQGTQRNHTGASHVGIVYEVLEDDVIFIHVAVKGGVRYDRISSAYYTKHYYKAERIPLFDIEYRYKALPE